MYSQRRIIKYNIRQLWLTKKEAGQQIADPESAIARLQKATAGHSNAASLLQLAQLTRQTDTIERSDTLYKLLLTLEPGNPDALNGLGWNRLLDEDPETAADYFQQVLANDPENRFALLHLGWAYFFSMDREKLIELSETLLQILPDETEIYSYLTWVWQWHPMGSKNDPAKPYRGKLLQYCEHALTLDNNNFCIDENLLFYYEMKNDFEKALIHGQRLVELAPEAADSWYAVAHIQMELKQVDEAITTFKQLLVLFPDEIETMEQLSYLYAVKRNEVSAADIMQQIKTEHLDSNSGRCWLWHDGLTDDKEELIPFLEEIRIRIPTNTYAMQVLGLFYKDCNRFEEAEEVFSELINIAPKYSAGWEYLVEVQAEKGDIYRALETAYESCEKGRRKIGALWTMADILVKEKMAWEAIPILTYLLEVCPEDKPEIRGNLLYKLGKAQLSGDNIEEAEQSLIQALKLDDTHKYARELLGSIYLKQKKWVLARRCYKRLLKTESYRKEIWQTLAWLNEVLGYTKEAEECRAKGESLGK